MDIIPETTVYHMYLLYTDSGRNVTHNSSVLHITRHFFFKWDKKKKRHIWSAHYADNWLTIGTVTHYNIALQVKCKNNTD